MNSTFFSTQDCTLITEGSPPCGQLGISHDGWYKVLNKVMDLSTQNSLICVHPYQDGPQCWSTAPCHSKPLPEVFHGCVASVLALTDFAGWVKSSFLEVSSYSAALFPILSYSAKLLLNSWSPAHLRSWSLETLCCGTCLGGSTGGMLWKHHQCGIISHRGGKDTACYFYLYKPIWTSSAHQIFFLIKAARL